jgi:chromosome segregation and condensation protein ScpB
LIALERADAGGEPTYRTTTRFLELFGLRSLADLPRPELIAQR